MCGLSDRFTLIFSLKKHSNFEAKDKFLKPTDRVLSGKHTLERNLSQHEQEFMKIESGLFKCDIYLARLIGDIALIFFNQSRFFKELDFLLGARRLNIQHLTITE